MLEVEGPPHDRHFTCAAVIDGEQVGVGSGRTKKEAEQEAARQALAAMQKTYVVQLCLEKEVQPVSYVVNCDCGYVARGETEDDIVTDVTAHVGEAPEMADQLGREQILAMAEQE